MIQLASPYLVIGNVEKSDLGVVLSHTSPQHSCKRCTGRNETQLFKPQDRWWHRMVYHREKCHLSWSKRTCKRKLPAKCRLLFKEFLTPKYSKEMWNMITICYNLQGLRLPYVYRPYLILSSRSFVPIGSVQAWRIPCAQGCVLGRGSVSLPSAWPGVASCRSVSAHHAERGGKESHCEQLSDVKRHWVMKLEKKQASGSPRAAKRMKPSGSLLLPETHLTFSALSHFQSISDIWDCPRHQHGSPSVFKTSSFLSVWRRNISV